MVSLQAAIVATALSGLGQTVLLDFYADWCGPCRAMNPTVESLVAAGYPVQRINKDQNQALAAKYGVTSIPCFIMLVDGREVDRVVGGTTYSRLERMCKAGTAGATTMATPVSFAGNAPSAPPRPGLSPTALGDPRGNHGALAQAGDSPRALAVSDAALLTASVRLRIEDPDGRSCGSGTIIDSRDGEALILTCGHIFRDSQGKGRITVDLFGPNAPQQLPGQLISYDLTRDVGLVAIRTPVPVATARLAPMGYRVERGAPVASVGCNNGDSPTVRHSYVTSLDKFQGPPNLQVAGQPVEGRSGGGLFSSEGYVLGVCNAADPSDREGLFAALGSIYAELDKAKLAFIYQSPRGNSESETGNAMSVAASAAPPAMPREMPGTRELASAAPPSPSTRTPESMPLHERAALEEIHRRVKEGAEVVCIVRPRGGSDAKSEVIVLDHVSPEFVRQLSAEGRRPSDIFPTSYEVPKDVPKPRKILLEWTSPNPRTEPIGSPSDMRR